MSVLDLREAEFLLYQSEDGRTRVEVRFVGETAWLSLGQMAEHLQRDKSVISRHVKNVFDEGSRGAPLDWEGIQVPAMRQRLTNWSAHGCIVNRSAM